MKRYLFLMTALVGLVAMTGCGGSSEPSAGFEKSELEKYVEENPVDIVTGADFENMDEYGEGSE